MEGTRNQPRTRRLSFVRLLHSAQFPYSLGPQLLCMRYGTLLLLSPLALCPECPASTIEWTRAHRETSIYLLFFLFWPDKREEGHKKNPFSRSSNTTLFYWMKVLNIFLYFIFVFFCLVKRKGEKKAMRLTHFLLSVVLSFPATRLNSHLPERHHSPWSDSINFSFIYLRFLLKMQKNTSKFLIICLILCFTSVYG